MYRIILEIIKTSKPLSWNVSEKFLIVEDNQNSVGEILVIYIMGNKQSQLFDRSCRRVLDTHVYHDAIYIHIMIIHQRPYCHWPKIDYTVGGNIEGKIDIDTLLWFFHASDAVLFSIKPTDVWTNDRVLITAASQTRRVLLCHLCPGKCIKQKNKKIGKPCDNDVIVL